MKDILVISKGFVHPDLSCRCRLRLILSEYASGITYEFSSSLNELDGIDSCGWQAVVLFFHEKSILKSQLRALGNYVRNGGSLVCVHGALASFKSHKEYTDLTGAVFKGHEKIRSFEVVGERSYSLRDELYYFDISDDCMVRQKSGDTPVCWTRQFGRGMVFCLSPGHRASTFRNDGFIHTLKGIIDECIEREDADEKS